MFRIAKFTASPIVPVALTLGVFAITARGQAGESPAAYGQIR